MSRAIGAGSIVGSFTTDGTLGTYTDFSHFTAISVTVQAPNINSGTATSSDWPTTVGFLSGSISATATDLIFDFSQQAATFGVYTTTADFWCLASSTSGCFVAGEVIGYLTGNFEEAQSVTRSGEFAFASAAVVPIPAALPLFGTGLAIAGLAGWRRKRKAAAV
jgi:hypothetical protein